MKKVFCEIHLFSLDQNVLLVDTDENLIRTYCNAEINSIPSVICAAIGENPEYNHVVLSGNKVMAQAVAEDVAAYSKKYYSFDNEIEIEVI